MDDGNEKPSPVCCNCGENHTANFRQCPKFKEYSSTVKNARSNNNQRRQPRINFENNEVHFPSFSQPPPTVHPPKVNPNFAQRPNFSRQSFRDAFVNPGESQSRPQQSSQCNNCNLMLQRMSQMQQQINDLTQQLNHFMSNFSHTNFHSHSQWLPHP